VKSEGSPFRQVERGKRKSPAQLIKKKQMRIPRKKKRRQLDPYAAREKTNEKSRMMTKRESGKAKKTTPARCLRSRRTGRKSQKGK